MNERMKPREIEALLTEGIRLKEAQQFDSALKTFAGVIEESEGMYPHGVLHGLVNISSLYKLKARLGDVEASGTQCVSYARQAVRYAEEHGIARKDVYLTYFALGQAQELTGDISGATESYEKTFDFFLRHAKHQALVGDIERHLGSALVLLGRRDEGIAHLHAALAKIRMYDEGETPDKRNSVWETGALLALGRAYMKSDPALALEYGKQALALATAQQLSIRKQEAEALLALFE